MLVIEHRDAGSEKFCGGACAKLLWISLSAWDKRPYNRIDFGLVILFSVTEGSQGQLKAHRNADRGVLFRCGVPVAVLGRYRCETLELLGVGGDCGAPIAGLPAS